jgi:hypothetical protein
VEDEGTVVVVVGTVVVVVVAVVVVVVDVVDVGLVVVVRGGLVVVVLAAAGPDGAASAEMLTAMNAAPTTNAIATTDTPRRLSRSTSMSVGTALAGRIGPVGSSSSVKPSRADLVCAAFLAAIAAALRFGGLTDHGLYRDDAWVVLATRADVSDSLRFGVTIPGFEFAVRIWGSVSHSTMWLQAPVLAASIVAVVLAYFLARRLGCGRPAALVAGGILAVSRIAVIFATRVKPYSFDLLDCVLVLVLATRALERPTLRRTVSLAAFSFVAVVFSASLLPVTLTAVTWCACVSAQRVRKGGDDWRRALASPAVVVAGCYLACVGLYASVVLASVPPPLKEFWRDNYITDASGAVEALKNLAEGLFYQHGPIGIAILVAIVVGVVWARPVLAPLLVGPIVLGAGLAVIERAPFGGGRTDMYLYPCIAIAAALGVQRLLATRALRSLPAPALLAASAILLVALVDGRRALIRSPYPGADIAQLATMVDQHRLPGDAVVVAPFTRYAYALYTGPEPRIVISSQYSTRFSVVSSDPDVLLMPAELYEGGYDANAPVVFAQTHTRVWFIATDTPPSDTPVSVQNREYEPEQRLFDAGFAFATRIEVFGAHADLLVRP